MNKCVTKTIHKTFTSHRNVSADITKTCSEVLTDQYVNIDYLFVKYLKC